MTDRDVVAAKLAELEDRLGRVRAHRRGSAPELAADRDASDLVVAHGYGRVVADLLYAAATDGACDLERFAREVAGWIARSDA